MSFQAQNWAVKQVMKSRVKFVLIMLANHADPNTGHCWPSIDCLMQETCCSRASIYAFLGALRRNGYITMRKSKQPGRSHDFWLHYDREDAPWIKSKDNNPVDDEGDSADETQDVVASPQAGISDTPQDSNPWTPQFQSVDSRPYRDLKPSLIEPSARAAPVEKPKPLAVATARQSEIARLQAAEEARLKNQRIPVIEGSEPWKFWVRHGHAPDLTTWVVHNEKRFRGWYFPSLFPPKSTGPPSPESLMTPQDEEELIRGI